MLSIFDDLDLEVTVTGMSNVEKTLMLLFETTKRMIGLEESCLQVLDTTEYIECM